MAMSRFAVTQPTSIFPFGISLNSGSSGTELELLAALMGYVEARKGAWGIYGDVVWGKFDFWATRSPSVIPLPS